MVTTAFTLCSQLEEIRVTTSIVHKVSRFREQFFGDETIFAQGKNVPTLSILQTSDSREKCISKNCVTDYWETDLICKGSSPSTPPMGKGYETVLPLSEDSRKDLQGGSIKCPHGMVAQ